jgi:glyoxylase-like metal-dependent hydrolase (beta-lactamase superfamily II)
LPRNIEATASGIYRLRVAMVNVYFVAVDDGSNAANAWVLVDAGIHFSARMIRRAAEGIFGAGARPRAIVLTHAHFDHVGALRDLAREWDVPIYAHELEMPYITGQAEYPPPDPTVGGGLFSLMSPLYPRGPVDVCPWARALPLEGEVPMLPGWRWIFTPGHSPGHVSFFREGDRALIAGDAFVTTRQESVLSVMTQRKEINGPPAYFTHDWISAAQSVRTLAQLAPSVAATGHGPPVYGQALVDGLRWLADHFEEVAMPSDGRYVRHSAIFDRQGVVAIPPPLIDPEVKLIALGALGAVALTGLIALERRARDRR